MGINIIDDAGPSGAMPPSDIDQYKTAIKGNFVPRNVNGVPENEIGDLGTTNYNWKNGYFKNVYLGGAPLTPEGTISERNSIISGKQRTLSPKSDFITANGAAASAIIEATTTSLIVDINAELITISTDIDLTSLSTAPATNNTCLVNDIYLIGDEGSKFQGEDETILPVDNMGSEISSLVGNFVALKHGSNAIMIAYVKSTTELSSVSRGFFYNSSNNPIVRETITNNDTLTLYKLGWVFVENDGTSSETSYKTPRWAYSTPLSPATGDYWYDLTNQIWKRYSGSIWVDINRTLIGWVVMDQTNCVASRSIDFIKNWDELNTITQVEIYSVTEIRTQEAQRNLISVNGNIIDFAYDTIRWNITTDLESGYSEAATTWYYLYLDENGQSIMSPLRPIYRADFRGYYHPFELFRFICECYNNGSSNLDQGFVSKENETEIITSGSGTWRRNVFFNGIDIGVQGAGGGGGNSTGTVQGSSGGNSSFNSVSSNGGYGAYRTAGSTIYKYNNETTSGADYVIKAIGGLYPSSGTIIAGYGININRRSRGGKTWNSTSGFFYPDGGGAAAIAQKQFTKSTSHFSSAYSIGVGGSKAHASAENGENGNIEINYK